MGALNSRAGFEAAACSRSRRRPACPAMRVRRRLRALGAQLQGEEAQRDTYFAHPGRDFAATDEALRLREAGGKAELTYKGPKLDAQTKTREELTVQVGPAEELAALLQRLGFREVARVAKRRETWVLQGLEVALDEVAGLGTFVEVEGRGQGDVDAMRARVLGLLKELGGQESLRTSYLEMLLGRP